MSHLIRGFVSLPRLSKGIIQRFSSAADKPKPFMKLDHYGQAKITAGALLPHQIIAPAFHTSYENIEEDVKMAELRWQRMVSDLYSMGKLRNSIAVYHTSDNMSETAKQVSVTMALLISELSDAPWKGKVFAFNQDPYIMDIEGESILEKAKSLKDCNYSRWSNRLDYEMVFQDILKVAVRANLKHKEMIKRLFVFTDLSFQSSSYYYQKVHHKTEYWEDDSWKYEYRMLRELFPKGDYAMPKIVFWKLKEYANDPLMLCPLMVSNIKKDPGMPKGVTQMVYGMSDDLLKLLLENDAVPTKKAYMEACANIIEPVHE